MTKNDWKTFLRWAEQAHRKELEEALLRLEVRVADSRDPDTRGAGDRMVARIQEELAARDEVGE